jgi:coatomer protein complex subunit gamma
MLAAPTAAETQTAYAKQLAEIPELSEYGPVSNSSSKPVQLTEPETEYQVSCVKHIFKEHVVFQVLPPASLIDVWPERANTAVQFNVSNTITDTVLEQVSVIVQPSEDAGLTEDFIIPVPAVTAATSPGIVYVSFTRDSPDSFAMGSFQCGMKFVSKEIDPSTGEPEEEGFEDEYSLEEVELSAADYIVPSYASFQSEWDRLTEATATETFALSAMESVKGQSHFWSVGSSVTLTVVPAACNSIVEILNMEPLGGTENPTSSTLHTLQLSGLVTGGAGKVLVRCRMTFAAGQGVNLELGVHAEKQEACDLVIAAIGG